MVYFYCPYKIRIDCPKKYEIRTNGKRWRRYRIFKFLDSILYKHLCIKGETRERGLKGKKVVRSLGHKRKQRSSSIEVK